MKLLLARGIPRDLLEFEPVKLIYVLPREADGLFWQLKSRLLNRPAFEPQSKAMVGTVVP